MQLPADAQLKKKALLSLIKEPLDEIKDESFQIKVKLVKTGRGS